MSRPNYYAILFLIVISLPVIYGFVYPVNYRNIYVKNYTQHSLEECFQEMDHISDEYFEGLYYIMFFDNNPDRVLGRYFINIITIYDDCSMPVIIHELAHHCQLRRGDNMWEAVHHKGQFSECEVEIWNDYNNNKIKDRQNEVETLKNESNLL